MESISEKKVPGSLSHTTILMPHTKLLSIHANETGKSLSRLKNFLNFAESQQPNRYGWLAFSFLFEGCVIVPLTLLAVVFNGNIFALWIPIVSAFAIVEIVSLAGMPTKITIPVLALGIVVEVMVAMVSFIL